jgi:hypothetical protein
MTNLMTRDDPLRYSNSVSHGAQAISQRLPSGSEK